MDRMNVIPMMVLCLLGNACASRADTMQPSATIASTAEAADSPADVAWTISPDLGDTVLLRLDVGIDGLGGIAGVRESLFPTLLILGDGSVLRPRTPQADRPLVPQFEIAKLDQADVDRIFQRAQQVGLLGDLDYGNPRDTDGGWTRLAISLPNGETKRQSAYGLDFVAETPDRKTLADFVALLNDVRFADAEQYQPTSYRISASRALPAGTSTAGVASWPLQELSPGDCIDATPEQIAMLPAEATLGTTFQLDGTIFDLAVAPVFPDGSSVC